jgi:FkbM family methyltransferase
MSSSAFYSQNFEDVLLARCFSQVKHGFYIDVGAQDEEVCSVTRYFYEKGWSGINIEPVTEFADSFKLRDRDLTICCAVGSEEEIIPMSVSLDSGLSSFNTENAAHIKELGFQLETRKIQVRRLDSILEDLGIAQKIFEFLKIDVEGYEFNVIKGFNLNQYRPKIILCEVTKPNTSTKTEEFVPLCRTIESYGYHRLHFDGLNQWWCLSDLKDEFAKHFELPPGALDSGLITPYGGTSTRKKILDLAEKLDESNQKLEEATLKLDAIYRSRSWKITRILRNFRSVLNF